LLTLLRSEGSAGWFAWEGGRRSVSTMQRSYQMADAAAVLEPPKLRDLEAS
jgi:hypothetical protein